MITPSPDDREVAYENVFVWHEPIELDLSGGSQEDLPFLKDYSRCEVLHEPMDLELFPVDALAVTFHFSPAVPPRAEEIIEVADALAAHDKTLGGEGLMFYHRLTNEMTGELFLVLVPHRPKGAGDRFRQLAAALGQPLEEVSLSNLPATTANGLCSSIDLHLRTAVSPAPLPLTALADTVRKFQVRLHHLQAAG